MGEIADMILEGLLDEETGEYIGDINEAKYGTKSPGFPISYEREHRESECNVTTKDGVPIYRPNKTNCPHCNKLVKKAGLDAHIKAKH
jgi:hypothetical protein